MFTLGQALDPSNAIRPNRFISIPSSVGELTSMIPAQPRGDFLEEKGETSASQRYASKLVDSISSSPATVPLVSRNTFIFAPHHRRGPLGRHGQPRGEPLDLSGQNGNCANESNMARKPLNCIFPTVITTGETQSVQGSTAITAHDDVKRTNHSLCRESDFCGQYQRSPCTPCSRLPFAAPATRSGGSSKIRKKEKLQCESTDQAPRGQPQACQATEGKPSNSSTTGRPTGKESRPKHSKHRMDLIMILKKIHFHP